MVFDSARLDRRASQVVQGSGEVWMQFFTDGFAQSWLAVFCAEDEMQNDVGEGLRHVRIIAPAGDFESMGGTFYSAPLGLEIVGRLS